MATDIPASLATSSRVGRFAIISTLGYVRPPGVQDMAEEAYLALRIKLMNWE